MKKHLNILSLTALATLMLSGAAMALPNVGDEAPDFTLKTLSGETEINLAGLEGKVIYLDFWASWCGPCRKAFPEVKKLHKEYAEQGMEVLAISLDRSPAPAIKFMAEQNAGFESLYDNGGSAAKKYGVRSIPSTVIVGPDGKVAYSMIGFDPRKVGEMKEIIEGLLTQVEIPEEKSSKGTI